MDRGPENPLLTLAELASRWDMGSAALIKRIKHEGVPFFSLREIKENIQWRHVRFRLADVERWEASRVRTYRDEPKPARPERRAPARRRLGAWK